MSRDPYAPVIDASRRDTSQGCRDTVAGESGQNLDANQDSVQKGSPDVQNPPKCVRERLARLAHLLIVTADGYQIDYPHTMKTRVAADDLRHFARNIYKALGVGE